MYKTGEEVYDELSKMTPEQRKCQVYQAAWTDKDISSIINDKLQTEQLDPEVKAEYEALLKYPDVMAGIVQLCCERTTKYDDQTTENIFASIREYLDDVLQHAKDGDHCVR